MPFIYEDDLKKDISTENFAPVYMIYGDDSYLKNYYKDLLAEKTSDGDPFFNKQKFEGDIDLQEVFDAVNQYPMMADKKSVLLTDYVYLHTDKNNFNRLCALIEDVGNTCVLIIHFDSVDFEIKKSPLAKKLADTVNKSGGKCAEINHRSAAMLAKMLTAGAAKRGCRLSDQTARYLIEVSGNDLFTLQNELEKLCAYENSGEISKETVDAVSVKTIDASVYDFAKQIFAGNVSNAIKLLDNMLFMRIDPMAILYNVSSSYIDMHRVYTAEKSGVKNIDIAKDFSYPKNRQFLIDRASQNVKKFNAEKLQLSLNCITEADKALKTFGTDARCVLEQLTIKLIYIIAKGESID